MTSSWSCGTSAAGETHATSSPSPWTLGSTRYVLLETLASGRELWGMLGIHRPGWASAPAERAGAGLMPVAPCYSLSFCRIQWLSEMNCMV